MSAFSKSASALRILASTAVVGLFLLGSVATTQAPEGEDGTCGGEVLFEAGAFPLEPCTERGECNEVCCVCDDGVGLYIAQGCEFETETCLSESEVCAQALADDATLCDASIE